MVSVAQAVAERVRTQLRDERVDPTADRQRALAVARDLVRAHNDTALARGQTLVDDEAQCVREVLASVCGYGPLEPYLQDDSVEELWVNAPDRVFVAKSGVSYRVPLELDERTIREIVERMLNAAGRRVDLSQPFVDASLPDGSRVHVVIPDVARRHLSLNVRKFLPRYRTLAGLAAAGSMPQRISDQLTAAMRQGASVLVSGATHAGKTTMLGALVAACPPAHRIVTVEDTFELAIDALDVVAMQGRQASLEGTGEITIRRLVKESLRMRPDRLVVGEVRDAEALDLLLALNTGVPCCATVHANSALDALHKLASLTLLAGRNVNRDFVDPAIVRTIDYVVHCERRPDGSRRISQIAAPTLDDHGALSARSVYEAA